MHQGFCILDCSFDLELGVGIVVVRTQRWDEALEQSGQCTVNSSQSRISHGQGEGVEGISGMTLSRQEDWKTEQASETRAIMSSDTVVAYSVTVPFRRVRVE